MAEWLIGNGVERNGYGPTKMLFLPFPDGVEESNEKSQSEESTYRSRFKPSTSQMKTPALKT
jgi:hypothetical protein